MSEFNYRTALNHRLHQDALSTQARRRMAVQSIVYRHKVATLRRMVRLVALDAALVGACVMGLVVLIWALA